MTPTPRLLSVAERLVPPEIRADQDERAPAELVVWFLLAIAACCFVYPVFYRWAGNSVGAYLIMAEGVAAATLIGLIRATRRWRWAAHLFFTSFVALVTVLALMMGAFETVVGLMPLLWALTIPLAALLTLGQRAGLVWVAVVGGVITGVYLLDLRDVGAGWTVHLDGGPQPFFVWVHIFGLGFMVTALGLIFFAANRTALDRAEAARAEAEASARQIEVEKASVEARIQEAIREAEEGRDRLRRQAAAILEVVEGFAAGDLTRRADETMPGEMGRLAGGFNRASTELESLVHSLLDLSEENRVQACTLSQASADLQAQVQRQLGELVGVRKAVGSVSEQTHATADQAVEAANLAETSSRVAEEGARVVRETLERIAALSQVVHDSAETVGGLGDESRRIGEVVEVVEDIAAQTHMLALNASIEAARAGVHGKGFAVVAEEVGALATRTGQAIHAISEISAGIQGEAARAVGAMKRGEEEVEAGMRLSDQAARALEQIVTQVAQVRGVMGRIAGSSQDQARIVAEMAERVERVASGAQEASQEAEVMSANADGIRGVAEALSGQAERFTVSGAEATV